MSKLCYTINKYENTRLIMTVLTNETLFNLESISSATAMFR